MLLLLPTLFLNIVGVLADSPYQIPITKRPFQVSLHLYRPAVVHLCGGTIVHKRVILTTASCIGGRRPREFWVRLGTGWGRDDTEDSHYFDLIDVITHEQFNQNGSGWQYDIAIAVPYKDFEWGPTVQPIEMSTVPPPAWADLIVSGFGVVGPVYRKNITNLMQKVVVKEKIEFCQDQVAKMNPLLPILTDAQFCAPDHAGTLDDCLINVGGPVTRCDMLVGIVVTGFGCEEDRDQQYSVSFVLDVSPFIEWVWTKSRDFADDTFVGTFA